MLRKPSNDNNNNEDVIAVSVSDFLRDEDGKLKLKGRQFCNLVGAQSTWRRQYHPVDLKKLGCYEANEGLERATRCWDFADVRGKCFPFHLNLKANKNPKNYIHRSVVSAERMQRWVLIRLKHTCNPRTLTQEEVPGERLYRKWWPEPEDCKCMEYWKTRAVGNDHDLSPQYFNFESALYC